jgi:hypothetical protein
LSWKALALLAAALTVVGCGESGSRSERDSLRAYLARVEPIRLGVNRLLDRADPILAAYQADRLSAGGARRRMSQLERRFAAYAKRIAVVRGAPDPLRSAARSYAQTYVLEDAYLSALAAALPGHRFDHLPDTQNEQRAAIIGWRVQVEVLAARLHVALPVDLQAAGRGEIAPSPSGS